MGLGNTRRTLNNRSTLHNEVLFLGEQLAADVNYYLAAADISAIVAGKEYKAADFVGSKDFAPNTGNTVTVTPFDFAASDLTMDVTVHGVDAAGKVTKESFTGVTAAAPAETTIAFLKDVRVVVDAITNNGASDTLDVGLGNGVGLPVLLKAENQVVITTKNGSTRNVVKGSTSTVDLAGRALKAIGTGGSSVLADGDIISASIRTTHDTPDDINA
jgi:hypothetical protein